LQYPLTGAYYTKSLSFLQGSKSHFCHFCKTNFGSSVIFAPAFWRDQGRAKAITVSG
jgi:hypothetical protein